MALSSLSNMLASAESEVVVSVLSWRNITAIQNRSRGFYKPAVSTRELDIIQLVFKYLEFFVEVIQI